MFIQAENLLSVVRFFILYLFLFPLVVMKNEIKRIDDEILTIVYDQNNSEVTTDLKHVLKWKILKNGEKEHKGKLLSRSVLA